MSTYRVLLIILRTRQTTLDRWTCRWESPGHRWLGSIATRQELRQPKLQGEYYKLYNNYMLYHSYKLMSPTNHMSSTHHMPSTHHISPAHQDPSRAQCRIVWLAYSCQRDVIDSIIDSLRNWLVYWLIHWFIHLFIHWRIHSTRAHRTYV